MKYKLLFSFLLLSVSGFVCGMNKTTVLVGWYDQNGSKIHYCTDVSVVPGVEVCNLTDEQKRQATLACKVTPENLKRWAAAQHAQSQAEKNNNRV